MNKRWYDADPVISNALNLIQKLNEEEKNLMANFIIREAANVGVSPDVTKFDCFWHRHDENTKLIVAFECMKAMEEEAQRELAFKIISRCKNTPRT